MKNNLEQLLNTLISKGWKPRGLTPMGKMEIDYDIYFAFDVYDSLQCGHFSFRSLVSKESGLWQFCCENGMVKLGGKEKKWLTPERLRVFDGEYQYRLIESSLIDESELEDFLLQNIRAEGEA